MNVNMEHYRIFYHVVREGSFSKGAQVLYVTQSAVSQAIKLLESELGQQLIIRLPKGIKLTKSGEVLYSHIEPAFNIISSGEAQIALMNEMKKGVVTLSAADTICMYYLPHYLELFKKSYPAISIKIYNRTSSETITMLKKGIAEIGFINMTDEKEESLDILKKETLEDCFFISKHSKINKEMEYTLEEMTNLPLILLEKGTSTRDRIDAFFGRSNLILNPEIELGSVDLLIRYAVLEMGVICVARQYIEKSPYRNLLIKLNTTLKIPPSFIGVVKLKNVPVSRAASEFLDIIIHDRI